MKKCVYSISSLLFYEILFVGENGLRAAGILMHLSCLPSKYGIGNMGEEAYKFVDFLADTDNRYWQILPLCPTSFGDSPYQSPSLFAGNPYFIDIDRLISQKLLEPGQVKGYSFGRGKNVDYEKQYINKYKLLKLAYENFKCDENYFAFVKENSFWLDDYALFMVIKELHGGKSWKEWEEHFANHKIFVAYKDEFVSKANFHKFLQYVFWSQWVELKSYANSKNIQIIGDMPIYAAYDSADVWANSELFLLNKNFKPTLVAGCPPDAFSNDGQLWGNPLYNWREHKKTGFEWWIKRIRNALNAFDKVRIDHFRGFSAFYAIPYKDTTARDGKWMPALGEELFERIRNLGISKNRIIAEDLGTIDYKVENLLTQTGFAGMKVLQFAFDEKDESAYLPKNHIKNCVVYTATHDNKTSRSWFRSLGKDSKECFAKHCNYKNGDNAVGKLIEAALKSVADTVIVPIVDYLNLDDKARFNTPSTTGSNWVWRMSKKYDTVSLREYIKKHIVQSNR